MFIFLSPEQELIFKETIIVEGWFSLLVNMKIYAHRSKSKKKNIISYQKKKKKESQETLNKVNQIIK